ncbi:MAG: hemolysin family protein [Deltaproteobacteria bacterium]|nr:hemolysin family protein [Deltaproteobacteria bacterium]
MLELFILLILILLNAFFAVAEIAIISFNDNKLRKLVLEGNRKAAIIKGLTDQPSRFLATIQVGVTLAGFLASAFASDRYSAGLSLFILSLGVDGLGHEGARLISLFLITIPLAYVSLVFGELLPKRLALQKPEAISFAIAKPLEWFSHISKPFIRLLAASTDLIIKLLGISDTQASEDITEEEIRMMVDVGEEKGVLQADEKTMINNIFEFDNKTAEEVMTHRVDIMGIPASMELSEVITLAISEKYTRFPVYEESLDNITGILHIKDLMTIMCSAESGQVELSKILRKPYFVSINKKTDELFRELQKKNVHMAIVLDEYGGTAGIVTIEDLLEEIVGNIRDEYDEDEEVDFASIGEDIFFFQGDFSFEKAKQILNLAADGENYDTLGGLVIDILGRIPEEGEAIKIQSGGWVFEVLEIDERRIEKIKVYREEQTVALTGPAPEEK